MRVPRNKTLHPLNQKVYFICKAFDVNSQGNLHYSLSSFLAQMKSTG